jgi:hypothetical protein
MFPELSTETAVAAVELLPPKKVLNEITGPAAAIWFAAGWRLSAGSSVDTAKSIAAPAIQREGRMRRE